MPSRHCRWKLTTGGDHELRKLQCVVRQQAARLRALEKLASGNNNNNNTESSAAVSSSTRAESADLARLAKFITVDPNSNTITVGGTSDEPMHLQLGRVRDRLELAGRSVTVESEQITTVDSVLQINANGPEGSSGLAGIQIQDGENPAAGFMRVSADRRRVEFKAPRCDTIVGVDQSLDREARVTFGQVHATEYVQTPRLQLTAAPACGAYLVSDDVGRASWLDVWTGPWRSTRTYTPGQLVWVETEDQQQQQRTLLFRNTLENNREQSPLEDTTGAWCLVAGERQEPQLAGDLEGPASANRLRCRWMGVWSPLEQYRVGNQVTDPDDGRMYSAIADNHNAQPSACHDTWLPMTAAPAPWRGQWRMEETYRRGDQVTFDGCLYSARRDMVDCGVPPSEALSDWAAMTSHSMAESRHRWRGEWNADAHYEQGNQVTREGRLYCARSDHSNQDPSASPDAWILMAGTSTALRQQVHALVSRLEAHSAEIERISQQRWVGLWQANQNYNPGNQVTHENSLYVCIAPATANSSAPSPSPAASGSWQLMLAGASLEILTERVSNLERRLPAAGIQ